MELSASMGPQAFVVILCLDIGTCGSKKHSMWPLMWLMWPLMDWWLSPTPLKNDGVNVSWDDEIPN